MHWACLCHVALSRWDISCTTCRDAGHIPHDSPLCRICSKDFCVLGSKLSWPDTEKHLKNCWPGQSHRDRPDSCFSVNKKLKEISPHFSKTKKPKKPKTVSLHRKYWHFYFHSETAIIFLKEKSIFCKNYCFGLISQNWTSIFLIRKSSDF